VVFARRLNTKSVPNGTNNLDPVIIANFTESCEKRVLILCQPDWIS
jgi:hypothetical protein